MFTWPHEEISGEIEWEQFRRNCLSDVLNEFSKNHVTAAKASESTAVKSEKFVRWKFPLTTLPSEISLSGCFLECVNVKETDSQSLEYPERFIKLMAENLDQLQFELIISMFCNTSDDDKMLI